MMFSDINIGAYTSVFVMANYCNIFKNQCNLSPGIVVKKFRVNQGPSAVHKVMFEFNDNVPYLLRSYLKFPLPCVKVQVYSSIT